MKRISLVAMAVVAASVFATQASAADLGGDCCADLEERIAELEATTARKGNRKVSLTVYGQVTTAVMFWDADGGPGGVNESNVYVVDPQTSGTRFGFKGGAKINSEWSAGYAIELQWQPADIQIVRANNDEGPDLPEFRLAYWSLKSSKLGEIQIGTTNTANSGIAEIDLSITQIADAMSSSQAGAGIIRGDLGGPGLQNFEFNRRNVVAYKSPTMAGFVFSSSYGEDDIWDVALRYAGTWGDFKVAAGIAYGEASDNTSSIGNVAPTNGNGGPDDRIQALNGGLSILHNPTGLFFTGSAGQQEFDGNVACANSAGNNGNCDTEWFWMTNAGIQQKINPLGKTAFFGMVGEHKENDAATQYWGLGAVQQIDAAAMDLYISYKSYDIDPTLGNVDDRDFDAVVAGGRIKF